MSQSDGMLLHRGNAGERGLFVARPPLASPVRVRAGGRRAAVLFVLLASVSVATRLPFLRAPFLNVDEAAHLVGSWELLRGRTLYVDFADNKPPLVYLFYAAAQLLLGRGLFSVRLFAAAVVVPLTALGAAAFFGYGRRGVAAALAFVLASTALLASDAHVLHCEHVMLLPFAWSLAVLRSPAALRSPGRLFAAGGLVGLAALGKQPAAACLGVYALCVLRERRRGPGLVRRWAALAAGFAAPLLVAALWLARRGGLRDAVFWIYQFNLGHIDNPMPPADEAARIARMGALILPAALPLAVAAGWGLRRRSRGHRTRLPALAALATLLPALLGLRLFGHYFLPLLFALSLAAAPLFGARGQRRGRAALVAAGGVAAVGFTLASGVIYDPARGLADVSRPAYEHIGAWVRADEHACDGSLFVWGYAPTVYAHARARLASRFVVPIDSLTGYLAGNDAVREGRLDTTARINPAHWDLLMADVEARRPAHVVDTAPADLNRWGRFSMDRFPRLRDFVRRGYDRAAVVDGAVIYRRKACSASSSAPPRSRVLRAKSP